MDDFTSAYLKRISELEEERKSTVFSAPIPLPTYSSSVRLPQRKGEPSTKNEKAPSVSSFKNDLVSKTSEKRVPDLENRLKIAADNANYQADKLERERSMSMAPVWNAQSLTGSYIPTAEQEQEVEDARAKGAELQSRIDALRRQANEYRAASQAEGYKSVINSSDFSTYSSRPESQRDTAIKKMSNGKADERYLVGLEHADGVGSMEWIQRTEQLTDQELGIYNYLRNKEGQESADKFLDYMEETLNQRLGGKQAEDISNIENPVGKLLATGGYGFISGVDQFGSGVRQLFSEKALPTSAIQFGAAQVREDLADVGPKLGSRSLGQAAFEGTQMIGNMLPSIAIGSMAGGAGISANVAKALGSGVMSASAGGNAYNEAVKQGYTPEQARSYGTLVALSEGGLQYLLGGISALGGRVSGSVISKTVQNIDNALLRAGAELGLNMLSEGSEEYLQEVLTPVFRNIALDENNPVELVSEEAIYSGIMGALSAGLFEGPGRVTDAVSDVRTNQELRSIDRSYADMQENGIFGQGPRLLPTAGSVGREGTTTAGAWYDRNVGSAVDTQAPKNASTIETVTHRMTMEDFTNVNSPVWNNVEYGDTETQSRITRQTHQAMVEEGAVVTVPDSTREQVGQSYPDLRGMKKAERTPILRQKMKELKASLRQFLNGLKGGSYEFNVNGNILEAKLYDTGVREVLEKIDQSKASMLYHSDQVFQNARYLYSTPDYDGDPNVYRWNYFYTPVQIGGEIVGVRIAVRDMVRQTDGSMDSQIYNWGIKTGAALDGGERGNMPDRSDVSSATPDGAALDGGRPSTKPPSSDVSSAAPDGMTLGTSASSVNPSRSSIPQSGGENNINTEQGGPRMLPTASDVGPESSVGAASFGFDPYTNLVNQYGAIEPGENPARVVDAPKKISDNEEVSQAVRTVMEAKATPDSMIADIQQFILEGKANKIPVTNKELSSNAENAIKKDGFDTVLRDWISKAASGDVSAQSMATGATLYNAALNAGDAKAAMDILFHYIQMSSESGKALQANRILKTLTPSGQLYMLQKTVSKINETVNKTSGKKNSPDNVPVEIWMQRVGENLADSLARRVKAPKDKVDTVAETILSDLRKFASKTAPTGSKKKKSRTDMDRIMDLFQNKDAYNEAWQAAKDTLSDNFENEPDALSAFDEWLDSSLDYAKMLTKKLTNQDKVFIRQDLAEKFLNAETDADRDAVIDEIYKDIAGKIPSSFSEKFTALRYLNMLGNFKTIFRNYGGNAIMYGVRSGRVKLESALQNAVYALSKGRTDRTTTFFRDKGLYKETLRDFESVKAEASGEQKYSVYSKRLPTAIQNYRTIFKNNGTWGTEPDSNVVAKGLRKASDVALSGLEAARKATSLAMETGDVVFLKRVYADAMARYLKAKGVTAEQFAGGTVDQNLLDEARAYSIKEAQEATFRDKNQFSDMISEIGFRDDSTAAKRFANAAIHGTLPFRRTPANVLVRGIEYSPVGLLDTAVKSVKAAKKTTDADGNVQVTGTDVINSLSKALTGTGLFLLGRALFKRGLLTAGEDEDDKQNALDRMQGKQAYSLHIPGVGYYSFDWASPAAMPLFMGAELAKAEEETGLNADGIMKAAAGSSNVLLNMSMLQGVNDQFDNVKYSEYPLVDIAVNSLTNYLTQGLTSTLGGQIERAMEDVRMTTYTDKNLPIPTDFQYLLGKASAKTPGIDYQQIKYTDEFGEEEYSGPLYLRAFENFISPGYISPEKESAVVDEAQRLYQEPDDGVVVPKRAEKSIKVDDETINLSADQYDKYNRTRGQTANQILEALIALPSYQSMSDDQKREAFQSVYEYATDVAKMEVSDFKPDGKTAKILKSGVPADLYMVYSATADANDDDNVSQVESAAALLPIAGLTEEQKGKIWQSQNTAWGEKKNPFTGALPKAGIDPETSIGILQKYSEIDDAAYSGGSVARQKQTALSKYLDTLDLSEKERSVVDDTYVFFNMFPASVIPYNLDTMSDAAQEKWPRAERMGYSEEEYVKYYPICSASGKKKDEIIQDLVNAGMTRQEAFQFWNIVKKK